MVESGRRLLRVYSVMFDMIEHVRQRKSAVEARNSEPHRVSGNSSEVLPLRHARRFSGNHQVWYYYHSQ